MIATVNSPATQVLGPIEFRVHGKLGGRVRNLMILVSDGGFILRGTACTYYAKQVAQHVLMGETDLPIRNEIDVI